MGMPTGAGTERLPRTAAMGNVVAVDPRHFGDTASEFDPDRATAGHVGFGFGPHFCLGAALARAEASLALAALDLRDTVLVGSGLEMIDSMQFRGRRLLEIGPAVEAPASPVRATAVR